MKVSSKSLKIDLERGVVPISKAASSLAALIKRATAQGRPIVVTQKGYPSGVLLPIGLFMALRELAEQAQDPDRLLSGFTPDAPAATPAELAAFLGEEA
jgi:prevent-host-death family protein